jgi:hypothetical protein
MAKSFCTGCRFWTVGKEFDGSKFHYCFKLKEYTLYNRKKLCNGKLREEEEYFVGVDIGYGNDVGVETTWQDGKIVKQKYKEEKTMTKEEVLKSIDKLCKELDDCTTDLIKSKMERDIEGINIACFNMERLIVDSHQELSFLRDYIKENVN